MNKYEMDMCSGPLLRKLVIFSAPLMLSGVLQLLFNAMDIVVVGRWAGNEAMAAVGSTTSLNIVKYRYYKFIFWNIYRCKCACCQILRCKR